MRRGNKLIFILLIAVIAFGGYLLLNKDKNEPTPASSIPTQTAPSNTPDEISGNYLFNGTVVLARSVAKQAGSDYSQPFRGLDTFSPEKYDAWMADFECPSTLEDISYEQQVANTMFNCRPEFLPAYRKYFQFANIAGNHTQDLGVDGYKETVKHLIDADIIPIGNYTPRAKEDICEVIALPVRLKGGEQNTAELPVAFCAFHYFAFEPEPGEIETIQKYAAKMPVFAFMHIGTEYVATAGDNQVDVAHRLIDNGADFVIGNSPHWVQNSEVYRGKLIVYSTGNFIFDQIDPETQRGVSIAVNMSAKYDDNLAKWLALAGKCRPRHDNCLELATSQNLQKIPAAYKFDAIGNTNGHLKVTQKAPPSVQAAIEQRLNWSQTLRELGQD